MSSASAQCYTHRERGIGKLSASCISLAMIYGILLAAGASARLGWPKQLLEWRGCPLVCHIARQALASDLDGLIVVIGAAAAQVRAALEEDEDVGRVAIGSRPAPSAQLQIIENPDYAAGQAGSLRSGLAALPTDATAAVVLLVDQPLVTPALINALLGVFRAAQRTAVSKQATQNETSSLPVAVIPRYQGQRGNPVLLARSLFPELQGLQGDEGARRVLRHHDAQITWLDTDDQAAVTDVDTLEEYTDLVQQQSAESKKP
ncbi:MAG: nucleotidyltransferase family protein [Chloroflexales bacterium]|nr:nucleotidyltransferase family protein [Chloroflexales bacterium]